MIRNQRQYNATNRQRAELMANLTALASATDEPWIIEATKNALEAQIVELDEEIAEYEELRAGAARFSVRELSDLPRELVRARIARDLTQRELADRIGIQEQQIQRYEANGYAGASVARLEDVMRALNVSFAGELTSLGEGDVLARMRSNLTALGLSSKTIKRRFLSTDVASSARITDVASRVSRVFGTPIERVFSGDLAPRELVGAFRAHPAANRERVTGYARYAEYLAEMVTKSISMPYRPLPEADQIREILGDHLRTRPYQALLSFCWEHGIPVVPLSDSGNFYGACWQFDDRPVIVLKNSVRTPERWAFLLAHEMWHAGHAEGASVVEDELTAREWREHPAERAADEYATQLLLGPDAEAMSNVAARRADHLVANLRDSVLDVAEAAGVAPGILADHLAFRVSRSNVNWWPTANRMHTSDVDPWRLTRSSLFEHVYLARLDSTDRDLLIDGMAP